MVNFGFVYRENAFVYRGNRSLLVSTAVDVPFNFPLIKKIPLLAILMGHI